MPNLKLKIQNSKLKTSLALFLILVFGLVLSACGSPTAGSTGASSGSTASATEGSSSSSNPTIANCAAPASAPALTPDALVTPVPATASAAKPATTPTQSPLPVPTVALSATGRQTLEEVAQEASKVRGLQFIKPVEKYLVNRADLSNYFLEDFKRTTTPEEIATVEKTLKLFGFVSGNFNYLQTYSDLLGEQVLGFYSPETKKYYVVVQDPNAALGPLSKSTTEHELTHALQDQYFGIKNIRPSRPADAKEWNDDKDYAVTALVEGDATQSGNQWLLGGYLSRQELNKLISETQQAAGDSKALNNAPLILRDTLTFPYVEGLNFVANLCKQGGWEAVNKAWTDYPPVSTSQILHFDKYTKKVEPVKIDLPNMVETLGSGWKSVDINTMGELQTRIWLDGQMGRSDSDKAANGWAGDRYQLLEGEQGKLGFIWRSAWDSDNDTKEFFEAAVKYVAPTYKVSGNGGSGTKRTWQSTDYDINVIQKGKEVLVTVMPKGDSTAKILSKIGF